MTLFTYITINYKMKNILILITLISTITLVKGQDRKLITNSSVLKAGIYRSYDEFKHNSPSIEFSYEVKTINRGLGPRSVTYYKIAIDKKLGKSIGNVFGFCDGKNAYINEGFPILGPKTEFSKVEYIGKYCYYKIRVDGSNNMGPTSYTFEKIIDIDSNDFIYLTKDTLREIIKDNPTLLNEFNKDHQKKKKLKEYLIKYVESQ